MSDTGSEPRSADQDHELTPDERAELARLRAEVARLRSRPAPPRHRVSWRTPVATLLIMLGCILAPLSVVAAWTADQVSNTDRYIANITPLIHEPSIQRTVTDDITTVVTNAINVPGRTGQAVALLDQKGLGPVGALLQGLSGPVASAVQGFVHTHVAKIVSSPQTARTWDQVNRATHAELVTALSGRGGGAIAVSSDRVTVDLTPFVTIVKQDLAARGLSLVTKLPTPHVALALFPSRDLVRAQAVYRLLNDLKIVLPVLSLLLLGLGVYLARGHRRALIGVGLGLAASMVILEAALLIIRGAYLNAVPSGVLASDAAAAAFDILAGSSAPRCGRSWPPGW